MDSDDLNKLLSHKGDKPLTQVFSDFLDMVLKTDRYYEKLRLKDIEDLNSRGGGMGSYSEYLYRQSDEYKNEQLIKPYLGEDPELYPLDPKTSKLLFKQISQDLDSQKVNDEYEVIQSLPNQGSQRR